jgi:hypothetical protein
MAEHRAADTKGSATLPARIQARLSSYYRIEGAPPVDDYVRPAEAGRRESLLIRHHGDDVELALHLPAAAIGRAANLDELCQIVEGVSHFLYVVERARRELPATQLELELQAEVDKYVMLVADDVFGFRAPHGAGREDHRARRRRRGTGPWARAVALRERLFERVCFAHPVGTETGDRYRMANALAARFVRRLEARYAVRAEWSGFADELQRFYGAGQTEKIALARAA